MGANGANPGKAWAAPAAAAAGVLALVALLFRAPAGPPPIRAPEGPRPAVGVAAADPVLNEEEALFDRTPLFLPTPWNSTDKQLPSREPRGEFVGYPDEPAFAENHLTLDLPPPIRVPGSLSDALTANPPQDLTLGMGRTAYEPPVLAERGAYVEIADAGTGRKVLVEALADARPPADGSWQPLEFIVAVDSAGLVGPPVLTVRSGVDGVDAYFRRYLDETLRVGDRLEPGFYRISVGP
jgi:hypothetical protein